MQLYMACGGGGPNPNMGKSQRSFMDSTSVVRDLGGHIWVLQCTRFLVPKHGYRPNALPPLILEALLWVVIWICPSGGKRSVKVMAKVGFITTEGSIVPLRRGTCTNNFSVLTEYLLETPIYQKEIAMVK